MNKTSQCKWTLGVADLDSRQEVRFEWMHVMQVCLISVVYIYEYRYIYSLEADH